MYPNSHRHATLAPLAALPDDNADRMVATTECDCYVTMSDQRERHFQPDASGAVRYKEQRAFDVRVPVVVSAVCCRGGSAADRLLAAINQVVTAPSQPIVVRSRSPMRTILRSDPTTLIAQPDSVGSAPGQSLSKTDDRGGPSKDSDLGEEHRLRHG